MGLKAVLKIVAAFVFRWFDFPVKPGLLIFGKPTEDSPVLVTGNFVLTVKRVAKYLKGQDCYLLVAPTKGRNVWCGASVGEFSAHSVISVLKTSGISDRVTHRTLIAPQLSAPGIDPKIVKQETGWRIKFGPVYAKDIPQYLKAGMKKTKEMQLVDFPLRVRLEMATSYFVTMTLVLTLPLLVFFSDLYLSAIIWVSILAYGMFAAFPYLPSRSGFVKAILSAGISLLAIVGLSLWTTGEPFTFSHLLIMTILAATVVGVDFNGMSPTDKGELAALFNKHSYGAIQINEEACSGCTMCDQVCPRGVFQMDRESHKAQLLHPGKCVNCHACVQQCPEHCLTIN